MIPLNKTLEHIATKPRLTKAQLKAFIREHGKDIVRMIDGEVPKNPIDAHTCHDCHSLLDATTTPPEE